MAAAEELLWITAGLVALLAATGWVCQRLRLPPALGYLLVGVFIPKALADDRLAPIVHLEEVSHFAVLVLLFFIGLELELRTLRKVLRETRVVSIFNILVPALAVAALARLWDWSLTHAIVLGIALSLSSTIFGERLSASPEFPAKARKRMFGVLLAEDVAAGALLALLALLADNQGSTNWLDPIAAIGILVVALLVLAAVALLAVPRILDRVAALHSPELVILAAGAFLFAFSAAGASAGSAELGAFLAGMAAAEAGSRFVVRNALTSLRHISLAVFFFASGLLVDPLLVLAQWPLVLACMLVVTTAKLVVHVPSSLGAGMAMGDSLRVGVAMSTVGEFSLILVAAAIAGGSAVAAPELAAAVTGTILGLLILAPLLLRIVPRLEQGVRHIPKPIERPLAVFVQTLRRRNETRASPGRARHAVLLVSALILTLTLGALAVYLDGWLQARLPHITPVILSATVFGTTLALAAPLLVQSFRAYRRIVRGFLRLSESPRRADLLKLRIADTFVLLAAIGLGAVLAVLLGASWTMALSALFLSIIIGALAWSQLLRLTGTLQGTLARVLGEDYETPLLLDHALKKYGWDVDVLAVSIPPGSGADGRTLAQLRLGEATGATVAVVKRGPFEVVNPQGHHLLRAGDTVVLLGDPRQLGRAEALLDAGDAPLRMAAESRTATVADFLVEPDSLVTQRRRTKAEMERETGVLVIGVWQQGKDHPVPWTEEVHPTPGDRVVVLGTPLQAERFAVHLRAPLFELEDVREASDPATGT